jgi:hypothetical protein
VGADALGVPAHQPDRGRRVHVRDLALVVVRRPGAAVGGPAARHRAGRAVRRRRGRPPAQAPGSGRRSPSSRATRSSRTRSCASSSPWCTRCPCSRRSAWTRSSAGPRRALAAWGRARARRAERRAGRLPPHALGAPRQGVRLALLPLPLGRGRGAAGRAALRAAERRGAVSRLGSRGPRVPARPGRRGRVRLRRVAR